MLDIFPFIYSKRLSNKGDGCFFYAPINAFGERSRHSHSMFIECTYYILELN